MCVAMRKLHGGELFARRGACGTYASFFLPTAISTESKSFRSGVGLQSLLPTFKCVMQLQLRAKRQEGLHSHMLMIMPFILWRQQRRTRQVAGPTLVRLACCVPSCREGGAHVWLRGLPALLTPRRQHARVPVHVAGATSDAAHQTTAFHTQRSTTRNHRGVEIRAPQRDGPCTRRQTVHHHLPQKPSALRRAKESGRTFRGLLHALGVGVRLVVDTVQQLVLVIKLVAHGLGLRLQVTQDVRGDPTRNLYEREAQNQSHRPKLDQQPRWRCSPDVGIHLFFTRVTRDALYVLLLPGARLTTASPPSTLPPCARLGNNDVAVLTSNRKVEVRIAGAGATRSVTEEVQ